MEIKMDREAIQTVIPHRDPFLLIDGVIEMSERTIKGFKNVNPSEPYFKGHFPGRPVMPGVLMIEAMAQLGGVLMLSKSENKGKIAYFASIMSARFRRVVVPGERLDMEVELVKLKSRVGLTKGIAKVGGEVACEAEMMFSMADK